MNPRERYIRTLLFAAPDRIPFSPGEPRESTLAAWHQQGLPAGADWRAQLCDVLGLAPEALAPSRELDVDFRLIPQFEERVLARCGGHLVVQDWKGNICEIAEPYDATYLRYPKDFVTRRWLRCPVRTRADWAQLRQRYNVQTPSRFPSDFPGRCRSLCDREHVLTVSFPGPFWQMREWCGFEGLCRMMIRQPDLVAEMAAFWTDFVAVMLDRILSHIVPDAALISEDMAYKGRAMISPAMTRTFCQPSWRRWCAQLRAAGCPLIDMDSDGFVEDLVPLWIESGFNVCNPVEAAALNDIGVLRRRFGRQIAYRGGVDKRAMARGRSAVEVELQRLEPVVRDGGFIPGCDHAVPPDVSWPDYVSYGRLLARMTGWL
jgi:uroporphyrinogen decarboxylase